MGGCTVKVIGFSYPGEEQACDRLCKCGFLSNHWDLGSNGLLLQAPSKPGEWESFRTAQAAFVALKFWDRAGELMDVSGQEAAALLERSAGSADPSMAGFGSEWDAMLAVLRQKFKPGSELANELVGTGEAFLLYRQYTSGVDRVWSDDTDGSGSNWLGLQLMLIRDELRGQEGRWTKLARISLNLTTGRPHSEASAVVWRQAVETAAHGIAEDEDVRQAICS